ncbi:hypothetical protein J6590_005885 [Homalodisca vitripennis]|nr:hypothetical protein J6590_005885 [Homalodisca vitripennis]
MSICKWSWTANILVGLTILIAVIRNIKRNEFCYTQFLIYTLILHTNVKQVFGICGKITIDMNSTLLKTVIFSEKVGDGVMVIRIGLGDILMVCSFAALFLETDFGYWGNVFRKIRLMLQNKYMQNDNERDMKCGPESAEKDQPSSFARMPTDLEKTNLKSPKASELSKPSEEPQVLDLSNKNPKNTIKGKKKMIEGKWVHVNYC